ncbi:cyclic diguanylate phosphodiesterase (EAL) domain-containing protein [Klebsiella pneumoniae]|nr:cyclic diguanylate phosphodiesterase (EAL) domain-containing protein [Klebsiella pneumoniae]
MGDSAPHKALRLIGTGLVILLPVVLALWFAQLRAKAETIDQLHSFSQLALQKTEMVIREADQARAKASQYRGELCSADHQRYLLHIVRGLLYVEDLIYAKEGANKQVISSQADSLIKISRIWADFFPANTSNQPI